MTFIRALKLFGRKGASIRGGILVEHAIVSVLTLMVIFSVLEWSMQMFVRQGVESAADMSAHEFSVSGDVDRARSAGRQAISGILNRCLDRIDFHIFDTITGADLLTGGTKTDVGALPTTRFARVEVECNWSNMFPAIWSTPGSVMNHETTVFVRLRD